MLYSRAGSYPARQPMLYAEDFSPNTAQGACPNCHGLGRVFEVTEQTMVPDPSLSIRERAIASWPPAWHGQNLRDILVTLGYDVDRPVARPAEEGSRLDPVHRGAADRAGLRRLHARRDQGGAEARRWSRATRAPSWARASTCCTRSRRRRAR
jgi:excinuclease UvrABC ATPase subunit